MPSNFAFKGIFPWAWLGMKSAACRVIALCSLVDFCWILSTQLSWSRSRIVGALLTTSVLLIDCTDASWREPSRPAASSCCCTQTKSVTAVSCYPGLEAISAVCILQGNSDDSLFLPLKCPISLCFKQRAFCQAESWSCSWTRWYLWSRAFKWGMWPLFLSSYWLEQSKFSPV